MHLPFLNRSNIKSPLASLRSTPGLVACYLPYMDVVGRNVGYSTTAGMEKIRMTHTSGTFYETAQTGVHNIAVGRTSTAGLYSMSVTFTPIGRRRFMVGVVGIVDTTSVSVISKSAWVDDIAIVANGDGSFTVNAYMDERAGQSFFIYTMPDDATTYEEREFLGDVTKGFTLHEWQVNFGSTLYPYSAPVGLSQSVVDRSGLANHAQLGSTAGADTNDPSWGTNALTFGGDDYALMPSLGFGDITAFTAFRVGSGVAESFPCIWGRNNLKLVAYKANTNLVLGYVDTDSVNHYITLEGVAPKDTWLLCCASLSTAGVGGMSVTSTLPTSATGYALHSSTTSQGRKLGSDNGDRYLLGDIACHVMFNRVLSTGEVSRIWYALKTLLAGQGVTIA